MTAFQRIGIIGAGGIVAFVLGSLLLFDTPDSTIAVDRGIIAAAALIMSQGVSSPGSVAAKLQNTADKIACPPDTSIYDFFPSANNGAPQVCQGTLDYNSFNGHGQVNALTAVSP